MLRELKTGALVGKTLRKRRKKSTHASAEPRRRRLRLSGYADVVKTNPESKRCLVPDSARGGN